MVEDVQCRFLMFGVDDVKSVCFQCSIYTRFMLFILWIRPPAPLTMIALSFISQVGTSADAAHDGALLIHRPSLPFHLLHTLFWINDNLVLHPLLSTLPIQANDEFPQTIPLQVNTWLFSSIFRFGGLRNTDRTNARLLFVLSLWVVGLERERIHHRIGRDASVINPHRNLHPYSIIGIVYTLIEACSLPLIQFHFICKSVAPIFGPTHITPFEDHWEEKIRHATDHGTLFAQPIDEWIDVLHTNIK